MGGIVLLLVWGLAYGGAPVTLQTWAIKSAPSSPEAAKAIYCFVFNLAIALGAAVGGVVVDTLAVPSVLRLGAALVLLVLLTVRSAPRSSKAQEH